MPFANIKVSEGTLSAGQKEEIVHHITSMFAGYFGEGVPPSTTVLVDQTADGGRGRADEVLTFAKMTERG